MLRPNVRGARWNLPGVAALYASLSRATALAEADHQIALQPVRPRIARHLHELDVRLSRVADLTDPAVLERFGVTIEHLAELDFTPSQEVGAALAAAGYDGMLVPSARADGVNLVILGASPESGAVVVVGSEPVAETQTARP